MIRSIMLWDDFLKKSLETFFYKDRFWTFISCPFFEKIFLSFKTCFYKIFILYRIYIIYYMKIPKHTML